MFLPFVVFRLLCNMYLNHMTPVKWNGFKLLRLA